MGWPPCLLCLIRARQAPLLSILITGLEQGFRRIKLIIWPDEVHDSLRFYLQRSL